MSYEVANEIAAKKLSVLVDLKWPEADKDADPDAIPSLNTLRFRERAPSSPAALAKAGVKFASIPRAITAPKDIPEGREEIDSRNSVGVRVFVSFRPLQVNENG